MAITIKNENVEYKKLYPNSENVSTLGDNLVPVTKFYIDYVDAAGQTKQTAIYLDENRHPFVLLSLGSEPTFHPLIGGGAAKMPAMKDGTTSTDEEVLYFDIYNENGIQEKIYLPSIKAGNEEFIENFKKVFSGEIVDEFGPLTPFAGVEPQILSRETANTYFLRTNLPEGDLVFNKRTIPDGPIDASYLYIAHKSGEAKDYLRLIKKEESEKLFINLNDVVKTDSTPPVKYADGTTFEVREFKLGENGATPPLSVLKAVVFDGKREITVDLPISEEEALSSSLFNADTGTFFTPKEIAERTTYTEIDDRRLPDCGNKTVDSTLLPEELDKKDFFYPLKDASGKTLQEHHYVHYTIADPSGNKDAHLPLIRKYNETTGQFELFGNFNTDLSNPKQFETCRIESIEAGATADSPCRITYVAGTPGKRFSGTLPITQTQAGQENENFINAITFLMGKAPAGATFDTQEIAEEQIPIPSEEKSKIKGKSEIADLSMDGDLSNRTSKTGEKLQETIIKAPDGSDVFCQTQNIEFKKDVANPFGTKKQKLSTFAHNGDPNLLLAVTNDREEVASVTRDSSNQTFLNLSKAQIELIDAQNPDLNIKDYGTENPAGSGRFSFAIDGVQLGQNINLQDVTIKAVGGTAAPIRVGISSQGMTIANDATKQRCAIASKGADGNPTPLDVAVSQAFVKEAISNLSKKPGDKSACQIEAEGNPLLPKEPLASSLYVSLIRQYRSDCLNGRNGLSPENANKPLVLSNDPLTILRSLPTGKVDPTTGKEIYQDFRVGPEMGKDAKPVVYYFGHVTVEHKESEVGGKSVPKWHKIERAWVSEFTAPSSENAPSSTPMVMMETRLEGTNKRSIGFKIGDNFATAGTEDAKKARDFVEFIHDPAGAGKSRDMYDSSANTSGKRNIDGLLVDVYARDQHAFSTVIDDNVGQIQRGAATESVVDPVAQLDDVKPTENPIEQVADPEAKLGEKTSDLPRPRPPREIEPKQLWKGIDEKNRKTWIAATALMTAISVFIPFIGIIASIVCGIIAASDAEIFKDIWIKGDEHHHYGLTRKGKQYDKELIKNQTKIRSLNKTIDETSAKISALETSGKNPKQIAIEKAKLEAKLDAAKQEKAELIKRDHELAVLITQDQDRGLRAELSSNKKWTRILERENEKSNLIKGLTFPDGAASTPIKDFDFRRSDKDLENYKSQLLLLKKDKTNKQAKDILTQQIEFCEMVQLYRKDVRKLSGKENARLKLLSERFTPNSRPPVTEWIEKIDKLIKETGLKISDKSAAGLKAESRKIANALNIDLKNSRKFLDSKKKAPSLYATLFYNLYGTSKIKKDGKIFSNIRQIEKCKTEKDFQDYLKSAAKNITFDPKGMPLSACEDLLRLKYLQMKKDLTADEMKELNDLTKHYPKLGNKDFDLKAELEKLRDERIADIDAMDATRKLFEDHPSDYYEKLLQEVAKAKNPQVKESILKAAKEAKFYELQELARQGILPEGDKKLLKDLAKEIEIPNEKLNSCEKGAELVRFKELLNKDKSDLTTEEKAEIEKLKKKFPKFRKDSSVVDYVTEDLISIGEAAFKQNISEEIKGLLGKDIEDLAKDPPAGLSIDELAQKLEDPNFGKSTYGLRTILIDQLEFQEYEHLRDLQSKELTPDEKERLEKLKKKFGSSKSPISSFLDNSSDYCNEISDYLKKSEEYISERKARAEEAVTTDELVEKEGIDQGFAEYDARKTGKDVGANIANLDDKKPATEGATQSDTSEYKGDGSSVKPLTEDEENLTEDRKAEQAQHGSEYDKDGKRKKIVRER